ncbi:uroporphyrinogen-III synthase [Bacillus alkalicellulosilyticus]|uniref:uroporphyrinogen-III synthase n=1 Tax=Alkalihalobacterium alkalicellulosilyticum TaxID=1912214 RepID=UPI0014828293|nr:uroporphyrinogen-III synthase [Bacillus alkalicellulosilyticus]
MDRLPLLNQRIVVTRAKEQAKSLSKKIEEYGGTAIEVPLLAFQATKQPLFKENRLHTYDWVLFTSVNAITYFLDLLDDKSILHTKKIAVVGNKTLDCLQQHGLSASLVPPRFVAESLLEELRLQLSPGEKILFPKGNLARDVISVGLQEDGYLVDDLVVYETVIDWSSKEKLQSLMEKAEYDFITFTSSSTVTHFFTLLEGKLSLSAIQQKKFACIGPITANTLHNYGITTPIIAEPYTTDGLLSTIILSLKEEME